MQNINAISEALDALVSDLTKDVDLTYSQNIIDIERFHRRKEKIIQLCDLSSRIAAMQDILSDVTRKITRIHNDETMSLKRILEPQEYNPIHNKLQVQQQLDQSQHRQVQQPANNQLQVQHANNQLQVQQPNNQQQPTPDQQPAEAWNIVASRGTKKTIPKPIATTQLTKVQVTQKYAIAAYRVPTFADVKHDGKLYYVESADHFAIDIAGTFLHGNIGRIYYKDEKDPIRVKNCRFESCSKTTCNYYHNPMKTPSKDRRNFVVSTYTYQLVRPGTRRLRFGSIESIDDDIMFQTEESIERFLDQTMHDLLCCLLLSQVMLCQS